MVPEADTVDSEPETDSDCDKDLVEIGGYMAKECIDDVTLDPNLMGAQKVKFKNCSPVFKLIHRGSRYHEPV